MSHTATGAGEAGVGLSDTMCHSWHHAADVVPGDKAAVGDLVHCACRLMIFCLMIRAIMSMNPITATDHPPREIGSPDAREHASLHSRESGSMEPVNLTPA